MRFDVKYSIAFLPLLCLLASAGCAKNEVVAPSPASANKVAPGAPVAGHSADEMKKLQEADDKAAKLGGIL